MRDDPQLPAAAAIISDVVSERASGVITGTVAPTSSI
jgi:hypothetical protein